jgi:hypothetical protein
LSRGKVRKDEETKMEVEMNASPKKMKTIEFIVMVGFHHKVGSQVEFIYPPLHEDREGNLTAEFIK